MSSINPLDTYLSPRIRRPPTFIYLHHPFHSSTQSLPPPIRSNQDHVSLSGPLPHQSPASSPSARIENTKLILTIPSSYISSPKSLYTTIIHLVHLCLFPDKVQREIEERGKFKEVFQWDTFVRALGRVLDVYDGSVGADEGPSGGDKGKGREMDGVMDGGNQVGLKRKRTGGDETIGNGPSRLSLMLILQDAQALPKVLGMTFESLLRLPKMIEHPISIVLTCPRPWDDLRPISGSGGEPIGLCLPRESKEETISALLLIGPDSSDPAAPVYPYFLSLLYATSAHLIPCDLIPTLTRMKEALWPIYSDGLGQGNQTNLVQRDGGSAMMVDGGDSQREGISTSGLRITTSLLIELKNRSTYAFALANEHLISQTIPISTFLDAFFPSGSSGEGPGNGDPTGPKTEAEKAFFDLIPSIEKDRGKNMAGPSSSTGIAGSASSRSATLNPNPIVLRPACPALPLYARYLVVAAYCASYNSVKSDMRMFGRGPLTGGGRGGLGQERNGVGYEGGGKAGGKTGQGLKKVKLGRVGKVPQYLLGPRSFPLERLLAIFQALLFEHGFDASKYESDTDSEPEGIDGDADGDEADDAFSDANQPAGKLDFRIDEDASRIERRRRERERRKDKETLRDWEEEVEEISRSIGLFGLIPELESMRLLQRTTPKDRLDGILIRCEAPKEMVTTFARSLKIDLKGYLVESE